MATASAERKRSGQASVETEVMKSHAALLPVEIRSEWPGHHSAGTTALALSIHKTIIHTLTQPPIETM